MVERLAAFVAHARWEQVSKQARRTLALHVLDSLACALGALDAHPVAAVRAVVEDLGGRPTCTLIGGGRASPEHTVLLNGALVRYLDFNDSYLAEGETCHPSDTLAAVLAAAEYAGTTGRELLTALAVAYQVQCRLSDVAPVRARGFDHTVQGAYAVAAGVSRALDLDVTRTANAIAIAGTALNALRVTRTGALSEWKGLAYPFAAAGATLATFLAARGITGPREVFEGNKGFMDSIAGPFVIDWDREDLERVTRTILKRYDGEVHGQSSIEAALELRAVGAWRDPAEIERVEIDVFDVAHSIIGGGEEGDKTLVTTREEADHSLPYMVAVALIDGQLMPEQYHPERIARADVQTLLRRVLVLPSDDLSRRFPGEHGCRVRVLLRDGRRLAAERRDYEGFHTRPMTQATVVSKLDALAAPFADASARARLVDVVLHLEDRHVSDLCAALAGPRRKSQNARIRQASNG